MVSNLLPLSPTLVRRLHDMFSLTRTNFSVLPGFTGVLRSALYDAAGSGLQAVWGVDASTGT